MRSFVVRYLVRRFLPLPCLSRCRRSDHLAPLSLLPWSLVRLPSFGRFRSWVRVRCLLFLWAFVLRSCCRPDHRLGALVALVRVPGLQSLCRSESVIRFSCSVPLVVLPCLVIGPALGRLFALEVFSFGISCPPRLHCFDFYLIFSQYQFLVMFNQGSDLGMEYTPFEEVAQLSDDFRAADFVGSHRSDYPHPLNKVVAEFCGLFDSPNAVYHSCVLKSGVQTFYFSDVEEQAFASVTAMNYNVKGVRLSYGFELRPYGFPPSGDEYAPSTRAEFVAAVNEFYKQFLPF